MKIIIPLSVATLLLLQVVMLGGSPDQNANAQGFNLPTDPAGLPGYAVQFEYRWISYYQTLPGDPVIRDDHRINFKGNATVLYPFNYELRGNGTGYYKETYDDICAEVPYPSNYYTLLLEGEGSVEVRIHPDTSFVEVSFLAENLTHVESDTECRTWLGLRVFDHSVPKSGGCGFSDVDLINGGSYKDSDYVYYEDEDELRDQGCLMFIAPLDERLTVRVDDPEIYLAYNLDQTDVQSTPHTKVTVKVTAGGLPVKNKAVLVKVCTMPGTVTTDGHIGHDTRVQGWQKSWKDSCDQGKRPFAKLTASSGKSGNLIVDRTDSNGEILLEYEPPKHKTYQYMAGTDEITATAVQDAPKLQDKTTVTTKVPDLIQMPGSSNCSGAPNYNFAAQSGSKHGCIFYGTSETSQALQSIAAEFMQRQQDCKNNSTSGACLVIYSGSPHNVTITGSPAPMRINAMSLPWGGLTDNVGGVPWRPPHASHNDGRQVDLSFGIFKKTGVAKGNALCSNLGPKCTNYDIDRIMLLRDVIQNSPNFYRFPSYEGGDLAATFKDKAPHIHIFFNK